ncbi:MAG: phosphatidate cytidylyltransferase [Candidatus Nitrosoglobus sp.]
MFRQRLITAAILVPFIVWAVLFLPTGILAWLLALVIVMGAWEWAGLIRIQASGGRLLYAIAVLLLLWVSCFLPLIWVLMIGVIWWGICAILLMRWSQKRPAHPPLITILTPGLIAGILVLIPAWRAIVSLHALPTAGPEMVLFLFILVWLADSIAYVVGQRFGHTRLAPALSPGKTWEGVYGAFAAGSLLLFVGAEVFEFSGRVWWGFFGLGLLTLLFSIVGDLLESLFKRIGAVKDSGRLLPGHGGVLDRVDSLTAASPVFVLGTCVLERLQ